MRIEAVEHCLLARFGVPKNDRKCLQINDSMSCSNGADHIALYMNKIFQISQKQHNII